MGPPYRLNLYTDSPETGCYTMRTCRVSYFGDDDNDAIRYIFEVENRLSGEEIYLIGLGILFTLGWVPHNETETVEFDLNGVWMPIDSSNKLDRKVRVTQVIHENGDDEDDYGDDQ